MREAVQIKADQKAVLVRRKRALKSETRSPASTRKPPPRCRAFVVREAPESRWP
jgi:hypothetical protein